MSRDLNITIPQTKVESTAYSVMQFARYVDPDLENFSQLTILQSLGTGHDDV